MLDNEICDFLVEIQKLRYLPFVDEIQTRFEKGIVDVYKNFSE